MPRITNQPLAATIAAYKGRHFPYTKRSNYFQYLLGLASELHDLKDHRITLNVDENYTQHYVYLYCNPLKASNGPIVCPSGFVVNTKYEIFYVGKGTKNRAYAHLKEAANYKGSLKGQYKISIIRSIWKAGKQPKIIIMPTRVSDYLAQAFEIDLIAGIGRKDTRIGTLANHTDGGDGTVGYIHTDEWKANNSYRMRGNNHATGTIRTEIQKQLDRKRMTNNKFALGLKHTNAWKNAASERMIGNSHALGLKHDDAWKKANSQRIQGNQYAVGYKHTDAWKKAHSERNGRSLTYKGKTLSVTAWALARGINRATLHTRLFRGWSTAAALGFGAYNIERH